MKKITTLFFIIFTCITACKSQSKMDLADLNLSIEGSLILNEKFKIAEDGFYPGYTIHRSTDPKLLIVNNNVISGSMSNGEGPDTNYIRFYVDDEKKTISLIALRSFVSEKTQLLHESLLAKFGKPDYYRSKSIASYSVWENKTSNNIYLLEHNYAGKSNGVSVERGTLYIIDIDDKVLLDFKTKASYSYYMKYLKQRAEKGADYTYEKFAQEKNEEGSSQYLKAIQNPVKH